MKHNSFPTPAAPITLQDVIDRLGANADLSDTRKRDLRSAIVTYSKILGESPAAIPMDLATIRKTLDGVVPLQAKVSRKRWANLRSDIAAAIAASGLQPMLKTSDVETDQEWEELIELAKDRRISNGLSRLARWATLRQVTPKEVDGAVLARFFSELETGSLIRNLQFLRRNVAKLWNKLVSLLPDRGLNLVEVPEKIVAWERVPWLELPASFRQESEEYLVWCSVPDPLDDKARARALAPETLRLRRSYIHLAASAACYAGGEISQLTSLSRLVEPETFKTILRQQWIENGKEISAHLKGLADILITMASEWVKVPADQLAELKKIRTKLGGLRRGLTDKNKELLRKFDDPRVLRRLVGLPDQLWRKARRNPPNSNHWFVELQIALAIDILLHVSPRIENLSAIRFDEHLHWPQGRGKAALLVFRYDETKNEEPLEFELPQVLSDRLYAFRNEIAVAVIGHRPDVLFVSQKGKPRSVATLRVSIQRAVLKHAGVKMTPHQFRHLAAQIHLDSHQGSYEVVRQLLGHKELKTTTRFYAGPNTRRAGRAHAELISKLREPKPKRKQSK
jgi:integrase